MHLRTKAPAQSAPVLDRTAVSVWAPVAGLAAAWFAAGSTGLLAQPLTTALVGVALLVALLSAWPLRLDMGKLGLLAVALLAALLPGLLGMPALLLPAVAFFLTVLAWSADRPGWVALRAAAVAVLVFAVYRLAYTSIPLVWLAANAVGRGIGTVAGPVVGRPLWLGASMAGVDFLLLSLVFALVWVRSTPGRWLSRFGLIVLGLAAVHLAYLAVLGYSVDLAALLPTPPPRPQADLEQTPLWHWTEALRSCLPWNVPLLAAVGVCLVSALAVRWTKLDEAADAPENPEEMLPGLRDVAWRFGPPVLALALPVAVLWAGSHGNLTGKTVVAYEQGFLNWNKPEHNTYGAESAGLYGMLPALVEDLGGKFVRSPDLSAADVSQADVLLVIHPNQPWSDELRERVWRYVADGGTLLLAAETTLKQEGKASSFNELLAPCSIRVNYDAAVSESGNWRESLDPSSHPACLNLADRRDRFGLLTGASLRTKWPAAPWLVGRWGWSEPGSDSLTSPAQFEPGKKLGDLVLAAEQPYGKGRVAVLGDAWSLTNQGLVSSYPQTARLLGHLAYRATSPLDPWRQCLGVLLTGGLAGLLCWQPRTKRTLLTAACFGGAMIYCQLGRAHADAVLPDGSGKRTPVAYIDTSHLEGHSGANWADDGINGLALTLIRNGYLPLLASDLTEARLSHAAMVISIAPTRAFSATEREAVMKFVTGGGIFLCTVGAEEVDPAEPLLAEFGFSVPRSPVPANTIVREPLPMGSFFSRYINEERVKADALIHAGWEVRCTQPDATVNLRSADGRPVIVTRRVEKGVFAVIGDSQFALNKNLEKADGGAIHGGHHNAYFWRWYLSSLNGEGWAPPAGEDLTGDEAKPAGGKKAGEAKR